MSDFDSNKKKLQEYLSIVKEKGVLNNIGGVLKSSASGKIGDGKIFISPIDEVVRIRTGETNEDAL